MQGHDFIFCLTDSTGTSPNFWGIDANGKAKLTASPYFLDFSPDGWIDLAIQNIRNKKYWGVDRSVTIPFGYVEDGARILKTVFYTKGPETPVYLKVCRRTLDYTPAPKGILAFTSGGSPFTPNTTATGTITGTPGTTVLVRFTWLNPVNGDTLTGDFDGVSFSVDYLASPPTFTLIIPAGGVINFNVLFTQLAGSPSTAGMALVNSLGTTVGEYGYWYKQTYVGQVDFSSFNHKGSKVTVTTLEDGLPKYLKANENTVFELPMNVPEAIYWKADGINLKETASFSSLSGTNIPISLNGTNFFCGGVHTGTEGKSTGMVIQSESLENVTGISFAQKLQSLNYMATAYDNPTAPLVARISGTLEFICTGMVSSPAYAIKFRFLRSNMTLSQQNDYLIYSTAAMVVGQTYTHQFSIDVPLQEGERLYMEGIFFGGPGADASIEFTENSKYKIQYNNTYKTTYIRALRPQYIFQQLVQMITESNYITDDGDGITNYFGTLNHFNKPFTSGNAIRGFDDATMKISWTMFFQFWDCFDAVGISGKGNKITFDRKKNLIDFNSTISLGSVSNLVATLNKEMAFNELSVGYPEIKNEAGVLNGNDEFNCGFLFSMGTVVSPFKLEKIPQIKASCYEIENIRIQTADKNSTDYKNDNEIYAVHVSNTLVPAAGDVPAHFPLDRTLNPYVTGLNEPNTVFNIIFSPKRNFLRAGDYYHSCLFLQDNKIFKFKSADKNSAMITTIGTNTLEEKANVTISSLAPKFFVPVVLTVDALPPFEILELLDANPLQIFDFDFDGVNRKGIMLEVGIAPGTEKEQSYKFLSTADNDLASLVDYFG